jgi:hypothetical protein
MKEREDDDMQRDITELEAQYSAALAEKLYEAINEYQARAFTAETFNAQQKAAAQNTAANLASTWYTSANAPKKSTGTRSTKKSMTADVSITEIYELMELLDETERYELFNGDTAYWTVVREELENSVSPEIYKKLQREFEPTPKVRIPTPGGAGTVTKRTE